MIRIKTISKKTKTEKEYVNPWLFNGRVFDSADIKDNFGFVYLITHLETGKRYIGRKYFFTNRRAKGATRRKKAESDWKSYYGSNDALKELVKEIGPSHFKREILCLGKTIGAVNFLEVRYLFEYKVLETDDFWNDNISGKYFTDRVKKYMTESVFPRC